MEKAYVTLSPNSWHFKLVKLVLGDAAPTPSTMNNFCPYWWLLVFSLLTCVVVVPVRLLFRLGNAVLNAVDNIVTKTLIEPAAKSWEDSLTDQDAFQIWQHNEEINKTYRKVFGYDKGGYDKDRFVEKWFEKRYGKTTRLNTSRERDGYTPEFNNWINQQAEEWSKYCEEASKERAAKPYVPTYEDRLETVRDSFGDFFSRIGEAVSSWKNIIKWTKRVTGALVTGVLLVMTYFVVSYLGRGILWLIDNWDWQVAATGAIGLGIIGTIALLVWLFSKWVNYMVVKGTKLWYVKVLYSFTYWCFWTPLKLFFYNFLWQLVIVNLAYLIAAGAKGGWKGVLGFLGIFGEYFGASYTDYCPGIRWEGVKYPEDETSVE